ncbi:MAG TPA: YtxH domain-containing protein [Candidatus Saccharimonadales bacterium]|nr:YtxH domain-containing protein [Candidatus Saccharimonadales bacterium]
MTFKKDEHTGRKIAIGSAIAGVAGYFAGILTAPKSGKETRGDIADKAGDLKGGAEDELNDLNDELKEMIKSAKNRTVKLSSTARAEFNEAVIKAKDVQNKTGEVLKAVKNGEASDPDLNKAVKQSRQAVKNLGKYLKT